MMASLEQSAFLSLMLLTLLSAYQNLSKVHATEHGKKSLDVLILGSATNLSTSIIITDLSVFLHKRYLIN
jgi:hypothetical protein